MKAVADTLAVARSNLIERVSRRAKSRRPYRKWSEHQRMFERSAITTHFELAGRNGEIVRVLFAIDACDREVMGWLATSAGISGEMVRDLMIACVERRFGISEAAHPSNGCPTTARLTSPRTRSTPQRPWASSFVSRQSARQNPTASRRHSSKPSNAIMLGCRSCRMLRP